MSADLIARALANKAQSAIGNGNLPYAMGSTFAASTVGRKLQETVSVKDFGAKGDDLTDDTAALQAAATWASTNKKKVFLPAGTYKISAPITFIRENGWSWIGDGQANTVIKQYANNVDVLTVGVSGGSGYMHSICIKGMWLTYNTQQIGNTGANCLRIPYVASGNTTSTYFSTWEDLWFGNGYCGIKVDPGQEAPWGTKWGNFRFLGYGAGGLTGSAIDWTGTLLGTPGNEWGRMAIEMGTLTDVAFKNIRGYAWTVESLEFLGNSGTNASGGRGLPLIAFQAGSAMEIGALKLENFAIDGSSTAFSSYGSSLIYAPSGILHIGMLSLSGNPGINASNMSPSTKIAMLGGGVRHVRIDYLRSSITYSLNNFVWFGTSSGLVDVGVHSDDGYLTIPFTDIGSGAGANFLVYQRNACARLSDDLGNQDYTLTTEGGPNILMFQTALTASRTVEIMPNTNTLFNGYKVRVVSRGAVNGANTLVVKAGGVTKATISSDNYAVELTWRRNPIPHSGWVVTQQGSA